VVNQTARRHQVGNALHHRGGHGEVDTAILRPTLLVLRPKSMNNEPIASRSIAFGSLRRR
jgi:hypothetical protein